jgi:hypothetical protein
VLHTHHQLSSGADTIGQIVADVSSELSLKLKKNVLMKVILDTVLNDSIFSFNYTDINEIFLTRDDESYFIVQTFRYEMQNCLLSTTTEGNILQRC